MIPDMNLKVSLMESDVSEVGGREAFCRKLSNYDICGGSHVLSQQPPGQCTLLHTASILFQLFWQWIWIDKGKVVCLHDAPSTQQTRRVPECSGVMMTQSPGQPSPAQPSPAQPRSPHTSTCQNCLQSPPWADLPLSGQSGHVYTEQLAS